MRQMIFADRRSRGCGLLLVVDGIKSLNDTQGHAAGNTLLVEIAQRLARTHPPRRVGASRRRHRCPDAHPLLLVAYDLDVLDALSVQNDQSAPTVNR